MKHRIKYIAVLLIGVTLIAAACKAPKLETGGVYAPTNALGQVVFNDLGLALADASYKLAYDTVSATLKFERDNRAEIWAITPDVKHALDKVRPVALEVDQRWAKARQAYRQNPTPAGLTTIQTILSEMQRLVDVANSQTAVVAAKLAK